MKKISLFIAFIAMGLIAYAQSDYVDLGLPSGTLWKNYNEKGHFTYDEATSRFGENLPTKEQWEELIKHCQWTVMKKGYDITGYKIIGPNGNSISLSAEGASDWKKWKEGDEIDIKGVYYWTSTPLPDQTNAAWSVEQYGNEVFPGAYMGYYHMAVRLVKRR